GDAAIEARCARRGEGIQGDRAGGGVAAVVHREGREIAGAGESQRALDALDTAAAAGVDRVLAAAAGEVGFGGGAAHADGVIPPAGVDVHPGAVRVGDGRVRAAGDRGPRDRPGGVALVLAVVEEEHVAARAAIDGEAGGEVVEGAVARAHADGVVAVAPVDLGRDAAADDKEPVAGPAAVEGEGPQAGGRVGVVQRDRLPAAEAVDGHPALVGEIDQLEGAAGAAVDLGGPDAVQGRPINHVDRVGRPGGVEDEDGGVDQVVDGGEVAVGDNRFVFKHDVAG